MTRLILICGIAALTGCGAETATTAATGAAVRKQEIEAGKHVQDRARQNIEQSLQQTEDRARKDGER